MWKDPWLRLLAHSTSEFQATNFYVAVFNHRNFRVVLQGISIEGKALDKYAQDSRRAQRGGSPHK